MTSFKSNATEYVLTTKLEANLKISPIPYSPMAQKKTKYSSFVPVRNPRRTLITGVE